MHLLISPSSSVSGIETKGKPSKHCRGKDRELRRLGLQEAGWFLPSQEAGWFLPVAVANSENGNESKETERPRQHTRHGGNFHVVTKFKEAEPEPEPEPECMEMEIVEDDSTCAGTYCSCPTLNTRGDSTDDSSWLSSGSELTDSSWEDDWFEDEAHTPPNHRVTLEMDPLLNFIRDYGDTKCCGKCEGPISLETKTITIATKALCRCAQAKGPCDWTVEMESPLETTIKQETEKNIERVDDYAINALHVLAMEACGDGPTEAGRLLGFLSLPHDAKMSNGDAFGKIEARIGPTPEKYAQDIMLQNFIAEVEAQGSLKREDFLVWKEWVQGDQKTKLDEKCHPCIDTSHNMGWQQRSTLIVVPCVQGSHLFLDKKRV